MECNGTEEHNTAEVLHINEMRNAFGLRVYNSPDKEYPFSKSTAIEKPLSGSV
jgi:hypothetical protein